ncbi:MAG: hypothetical protein HQ552_04260 [Desulfobacteraceae bacterium]|nr:hypothetical protein [Desulfobacteraceae bacterium]
MKNVLLKFLILASMLLGLPMLGIVLAGYPIVRYLEFPPETLYISHAPFSWVAFTAYTLFITAVVLPLFIPVIRSIRRTIPDSVTVFPFPWWGRLGVITGMLFWILAWTRFSWFAGLQPHTFTPLWLSYILVINALCYRRTGRCMLINRRRYFLLLFPASAAFWWFFEYLNRFVQNWHYTGVHYGAVKYFCLATLPFSTVLPAVLGTREWIAGFPWMRQGFKNFLPLGFSHPKIAAQTALVISACGLTGIGIWPDYLFPLLWVSPLMIIVSLQALMRERHVLSDIFKGDWRGAISSAAAALFCGLFWEMWNYYSLAKWQYSVPFVHRFQIFEMPLLGYAGYLPFGLECLVIGDLLSRLQNPVRQIKSK